MRGSPVCGEGATFQVSSEIQVECPLLGNPPFKGRALAPVPNVCFIF